MPSPARLCLGMAMWGKKLGWRVKVLFYLIPSLAPSPLPSIAPNRNLSCHERHGCCRGIASKMDLAQYQVIPRLCFQPWQERRHHLSLCFCSWKIACHPRVRLISMSSFLLAMGGESEKKTLPLLLWQNAGPTSLSLLPPVNRERVEAFCSLCILIECPTPQMIFK